MDTQPKPTEWTDDSPDWDDVGKMIEARKKSGEIVSGRLCAEELWTEEDEWPVFSIEIEDGSEISFYDYDEWRLAS